MRVYVLIALVGIAVILAVRAWNTEKIPYISFALIVALAAPLAIMEGRWVQTERQLSAAAAYITGRPDASISCQRLSETLFFAGAELGHVWFDEKGQASDTAFLTYQTCQTLREWIASDHYNPTEDEVIAVHVLTHESMHLKSVKNESLAECYAMQNDAAVARFLGADKVQARELANQYARYVYPRMKDNYRTPECGEDLPMDLTPGDGVWP